MGSSENGCTRRRAEHKNHIWSYDYFVMDQTEDGRRLKMMPMVDEYTRECLHLEVERSITAGDVVSRLEALFGERGEPSPASVRTTVRSHRQGRKALAFALRSRNALHRARFPLPWENVYSEAFISRLGDELLKREVFTSLVEAKVLVEEYRQHYNYRRPHSALCYKTPSEFASLCELGGESTRFASEQDHEKELESALKLS